MAKTSVNVTELEFAASHIEAVKDPAFFCLFDHHEAMVLSFNGVAIVTNLLGDVLKRDTVLVMYLGYILCFRVSTPRCCAVDMFESKIPPHVFSGCDNAR